MVARHDYITPFYEGDKRWTKPILIYWTMMATQVLFGDNEFSARLPSVLAGVFGVWAVYYFLLKLRGFRTAVIGACVLMTIPEYFFMARQAMPDMLMNGFLAAALAFFALAGSGGETQTPVLLAVLPLRVLAFLAKGPVACALVALSVLLFWASTSIRAVLLLAGLVDKGVSRSEDEPASRFRCQSIVLAESGKDVWHAFSFYQIGWGILIFLLIGCPGTPSSDQVRPDFYERFIVDQHLQRMGEVVHAGWRGTPTTTSRRSSRHVPWNSLLPAAIVFLCYGFRSLDDRLRQTWYYVAWASRSSSSSPWPARSSITTSCRLPFPWP